ncbi:MAG: hypothetical protein AAGJ83_13275, partial [Planctomycetota bacterium]
MNRVDLVLCDDTRKVNHPAGSSISPSLAIHECVLGQSIRVPDGRSCQASTLRLWVKDFSELTPVDIEAWEAIRRETPGYRSPFFST